MARGFKVRHVGSGRNKEPRYAARMDADERAIVAGLMLQVAELIEVPEAPGPAASGDAFEDIVARLGMSVGPVGPGPDAEEGSRAERPGHVAESEDPAVRRLFPIANRTDPEAAAEFARLSESGLRQRKRDREPDEAFLIRLPSRNPPLWTPPRESWSWMTARPS